MNAFAWQTGKDTVRDGKLDDKERNACVIRMANGDISGWKSMTGMFGCIDHMEFVLVRSIAGNFLNGVIISSLPFDDRYCSPVKVFVQEAGAPSGMVTVHFSGKTERCLTSGTMTRAQSSL